MFACFGCVSKRINATVDGDTDEDRRKVRDSLVYVGLLLPSSPLRSLPRRRGGGLVHIFTHRHVAKKTVLRLLWL